MRSGQCDISDESDSIRLVVSQDTCVRGRGGGARGTCTVHYVAAACMTDTDRRARGDGLRDAVVMIRLLSELSLLAAVSAAELRADPSMGTSIQYLDGSDGKAADGRTTSITMGSPPHVLFLLADVRHASTSTGLLPDRHTRTASDDISVNRLASVSVHLTACLLVCV